MILLVLLLFSSCLFCCDKPCGPQEVCYPGVGCIPLEGYVKSETHTTTTTSTLFTCFNVTIDTTLTPTLRCTSANGKVIDLNRCRASPILMLNGIAQQGAPLNCGGLPCDPNFGCFGAPLGSPILINCCGICIDTTATPTIHCSSFTSCEIIDTDQCHGPFITPPNNSTCVTQGDLIQCPFNQDCLPDAGCITPVTDSPTPLPLTQTNGSDDRFNLIIFFVFIALLFIVVFGIAAFILFIK